MVELLLIKYREGDRFLIKPKSEEDMAIFKHCAGGMIAVTEDNFEKNVSSVLICHGITSFGIESVV